jgi:hypothetical protein
VRSAAGKDVASNARDGCVEKCAERGARREFGRRKEQGIVAWLKQRNMDDAARLQQCLFSTMGYVGARAGSRGRSDLGADRIAAGGLAGGQPPEPEKGARPGLTNSR